MSEKREVIKVHDTVELLSKLSELDKLVKTNNIKDIAEYVDGAADNKMLANVVVTAIKNAHADTLNDTITKINYYEQKLD